MEEAEKIKNFMEGFFSSIKAKTDFKNNCLIVSNVHPQFEKIYGKKAPYFFVFEKKYLDTFSEAELLTKGSLILKVASEFLEEKGKTTLLKIHFDSNFKEEVVKRIKLNNCKLINIVKKEKNNYIYRFTFQTTLQSKNDQEKTLSEVYIQNNQPILNFNINDFNFVEGKKNEIEIENVKEIYPQAKSIVQEKTKILVENLSQNLEKSLKKETDRVDKHYSHLIEEIIDEYEKNTKQFLEVKEKLKTANGEEKTKLLEKLTRINQNIERIKKEGKREQLEKEKAFFLNDEKHKHSINVKNSLLNTTIIYYPTYILTLSLKNSEETFRQIEVLFDPMTNSFSQIHCDSCKKPVREIILCSSGHITCNTCGSKCSCKRIICESCRKLECKICKKTLCAKCYKKCHHCFSIVCSSHTNKDFMSGKDVCTNCSSICSVCHNYTLNSYFKKCEKCKRDICPKCIGRGLNSTIGKTLCKNCSSSH